jgi:hypothetical protein
MQAFDSLCKELVTVVQESHDWAAANDHPEVSTYPQYARIKEIGEQIHELAGVPGLQLARKALQARCRTADGSGKARPAESAWEGIGGWAP